MIGIPGEYQAWAMRQARGDLGQAVQMSDVVLRHRLDVAGDTDSQGLASEAKQLPQVVDDGLLYLCIGARQLLLLQSAAHKGPQQHLILGRSTSKFDAAKGAGQQGPLFNGRYDETHTI